MALRNQMGGKEHRNMLNFITSLGFYLLQNISNKEYGRRFGGGEKDTLFIQNGMCVCISAAVMALSGGFGMLGGVELLFALLFGIFYLLTIFLLLCAFSCGSMGGSTLLCNIGMFLAALYGVAVFQDNFTVGIGIGVICMLAAVLLSVPRGEGTGGKKWFFFALSAGLSNGVVGSIKSTAIRLSTGLEIRVFLGWGFGISALLFILVLLVKRYVCKEMTVVKRRSYGGVLLCGMGSGVGTALANLFQMKALEQLSSAIVYPFTAGCLVVILWLVSLLVYREERLRVGSVISAILCVLAIFLVNT